jgi:hypothetical protein
MWGWKGKNTVRYLEIQDFYWFNTPASFPGGRQTMTDFRGTAQIFQGLSKLIIYPSSHVPKDVVNNFEDTGILNDCYNFFRQQFINQKEGPNSDEYKIPEISIVGFPRHNSIAEVVQS